MFVYFFRGLVIDGQEYLKVGMTANPKQREKELKAAQRKICESYPGARMNNSRMMWNVYVSSREDTVKYIESLCRHLAGSPAPPWRVGGCVEYVFPFEDTYAMFDSVRNITDLHALMEKFDIRLSYGTTRREADAAHYNKFGFAPYLF